ANLLLYGYFPYRCPAFMRLHLILVAATMVPQPCVIAHYQQHAKQQQHSIATAGTHPSSPDTSTFSTSWDSSPFHLEAVTDNGLGLTAKACAERFCHVGINGLDLWLSLEEVCLVAPPSQPYLTEKTDRRAGVESSVGRWSPVMSATLCALVLAVCTLLGYRVGAATKPYFRV
ncbi:unnamed protein product, partial [Ascophyllum nodosum]